MTDIVMKIEQRRAEIGMTMEEMSYRSGVPLSTYRQWLYCNREPSWTRANKLLKVLGLQIVYKEIKKDVSDDQHGKVP